MVAEKGQNLGQIQIINNGKVISTFIFYLAIEENLIYSSSITSTNEFEIFNDLIDEARVLIPEIKKMLQNKPVVSISQPTDQDIGALWFVETIRE